ncbi:MAG: dTMP kinase [Planctomycetes bacterium]|nr:dTMP kinase [Planctomycetota bacterium]
MNHWTTHLTGKFVVFDGPDGSGKSTQFARFLSFCRERGLDLCEVREPGGTSIGEQIRRVLLDPDNADMSLRCEMMLYMASRSQLIEQVIRPALEAGKLVLADRFVSSTLAYQGTAGGMAQDDIIRVARVAIEPYWPDLTVVFDVDEHVASSRLNPLLDRMELKGEVFHRRVREGFLHQAENSPDTYLVIDASSDEDAVYQALLSGMESKFGT